MFTDIIYDDMNYFWNQDYKDIFVVNHSDYMTDKYKKTKFDFPLKDILIHPKEVSVTITRNLNKDRVSNSLF